MTLSEWMSANGVNDAALARRLGIAHYTAARRYRVGMNIPRPALMARITAATEGRVTASDFITAWNAYHGKQ